MHAHRKIELQPSARLAQTGLAGQHNETEQERRRGAALIHLSTYRAATATSLPTSPRIVVCRPALSALARAFSALADFPLCGGDGWNSRLCVVGHDPVGHAAPAG